MIWDSIFLMTVIDLLIVGIASYALACFLKSRTGRGTRRIQSGFGAIVLGLVLIGGFCFADLTVMHVLPLFAPMARAMAVMTTMHSIHWVALLLGVGLIGFGLVAATRRMFALVDKLEASEGELTRELELHAESEHALRESEARLERAQQQAKLGYWRWSFAEERLTYWSEETARLCGYLGHGPRIGYDDVARSVHPEDRERVLATYRAADAARSGFEIDYRVLIAEGEVRHLREMGEVELDADGAPVAQVGTLQDITELKKTEEALRKSEASLANAQRIARLGYWDLDIVTSELYWSDEIFRIFQVSKESFDGTSQAFYARVDPNDREFVRRSVEAAIYQGQTFDIDHRIVLPDGELRYVHEQAEVIRDDAGRPVRMSGTVHDITDRKRAEEALWRSEARLANAQRIAQLGHWDRDIVTNELWWSDETYRIFGLEPQAFGATYEAFLEIVHPDDREMVREAVERALAERRPYSIVHRIVLPDGEVRFVHEQAEAVYDDAGQPVRINGTIHDITERKAAESAILLGKEQAEIANRAKSEFLANMSHELRTPLNAIIGFAEIIAGEVLGSVGNAKYRGYAKDISDSGQHLLEIINDILDLSKIETGQAALREEEIDVPAAVRSCLKLLKERAKSAGVELVADFGEGAYPPLRADRRMVKQILVNLLSNAVKFTPRGGRVTASAQCDRASGCVLQISDTGIGIAPDDIPKALARFGQVDARLDRRFEGTGLGLPLSKSFVELHGGVLELTSEVGVGTTVKVRFPPERMLPLAEDIGSQDRAIREAS